jgi:hypothetical protein
MKRTVKLLHWHAAEARALAARLAVPGVVVDAALPPAPVLLRELRRRPPAAVVISLDRLPSAGRDFAFGLRGQKSTGALPLVFVGGAPDKVAGVRARLPDAVFASWEQAGPALARLLEAPPATAAPAPAAPAGVMAGYAGTPLPKKLGIMPGAHVALLGAPPDFAATLGPLPAGARSTDAAGADTALTLWFVRHRRDLDRGLAEAVALAARMPVWIISPKKSGPLTADLSQNDVRAACLAAGLVDYKVCAVDAAWSGLLFTRRGRTSGTKT